MNIIRKIWLKLFPHFTKSCDLVDRLRSQGIEIGKGTTFYSPASIRIDVQRPWMISIGEYCKITAGCVILAHDYSRSVIRRSHNMIIGEAGKTVIGDNVFIGMNSIILMGAKIGNNSIVGAGSVVKGIFPDNSVIAGNPARVVCTLDEYVEKRKKKYVSEAFLYASEYYKKYNKMPIEKEMGPFFTLFLNRDKEQLYEKNIFVAWTGDEENEIIECFMNSSCMYDGYSCFIDAVKESINRENQKK